MRWRVSCSTFMLVGISTLMLGVGWNAASGQQQTNLPRCSGTLPLSLPCTQNKQCADPDPENGNCATWINSMSNAIRCSGEGAEEGDHCVTTNLRVGCATKGLCNKRVRPRQEVTCEPGVATGTIYVFVAVEGGDCYLGPPPG
jgi:hypothetical protein